MQVGDEVRGTFVYADGNVLEVRRKSVTPPVNIEIGIIRRRVPARLLGLDSKT